MRRIIKEPLIQFLIIGACIYGAYGLFGATKDDAEDYRIVVNQSRIEGFVTAWQSRMGRAPTEQELNGMIDQYLKEEILYREAAAMGLGENDPITRRRLAQKLEFLTKDIARLKEPVDGELEAYFEANRSAYREPDLITFTHVFIDPDKRDDATLGDAEALLIQLKATGEPDETARELGDRFMLQNYYPQKDELAIRRNFGIGFSGPVMELAPGQWHGPVLSGYGVHLVYVHALQVAPPADFKTVQEAVFDNWQVEQQENFNASYFESLRSRYEIVVERQTDAERQTDVTVGRGGATQDPEPTS